MIIVRVELHSAKTGNVKELARLSITNTGKNLNHPVEGDYTAKVYKAPKFQAVIRRGELFRHRRQSKSVWTLIGKMLKSMGYIK